MKIRGTEFFQLAHHLIGQRPADARALSAEFLPVRPATAANACPRPSQVPRSTALSIPSFSIGALQKEEPPDAGGFAGFNRIVSGGQSNPSSAGAACCRYATQPLLLPEIA